MPADHDAVLTVDHAAGRATRMAARRALWADLIALFDRHRPSAGELDRIGHLSALACDRVLAAHGMAVADALARLPQFEDFASCGALYGYALGVAEGRARALATQGGD